ncbi:hypothetical protein SK128_000977 [Halocaridina rubra]|uniref:Ig-like domain-containing protein n=1 Tax=Halocaridina rubra TaxID=373956 RepID=A0AAN8XHZ1_HALRR
MPTEDSICRQFSVFFIYVTLFTAFFTAQGRQSQETLDLHQIIWGEANTNRAYFDKSTPRNITSVVGQKTSLPCKVVSLDKKNVSWIRKRDLHILTVGVSTYTSDDRFQVYHPEDSNEWHLQINSVNFKDSGAYECQVSTSPKISLPVLLSVEVQQARIIGPKELYIEKGSTIKLTCVVNAHADTVGNVRWFRDTTELDYDSTRGGISLEIEKTPLKTTSKLFLTKATKKDSGNYTCGPDHADHAIVFVHVVSGK